MRPAVDQLPHSILSVQFSSADRHVQAVPAAVVEQNAGSASQQGIPGSAEIEFASNNCTSTSAKMSRFTFVLATRSLILVRIHAPCPIEVVEGWQLILEIRMGALREAESLIGQSRFATVIQRVHSTDDTIASES